MDEADDTAAAAGVTALMLAPAKSFVPLRFPRGGAGDRDGDDKGEDGEEAISSPSLSPGPTLSEKIASPPFLCSLLLVVRS